MTQQLITVTRQGTSGLSLTPGVLNVNDGDEVVWEFPELPQDQFGFVFFEPRLGPFHSLRSAGNQKILGKGNVGPRSSNVYSYTAMILQLDVVNPVATGTGTLENRATQVNTAPEVFVTYHPDHRPGIPNHLEVQPFELPLNTGDTATWYFINLPEGAFPDFRFEVGTSNLNESTGPFVAFYACDGRGAVTVRGNGTGFVTAIAKEGQLPQYRYHLEVRNELGELLGSHDPVIANLGPPLG